MDVYLRFASSPLRLATLRHANCELARPQMGAPWLRAFSLAEVGDARQLKKVLIVGRPFCTTHLRRNRRKQHPRAQQIYGHQAVLPESWCGDCTRG